MRKRTLIAALTIVLITGVVSFAQYTGSDIERKRPENLHPEPGPGELLIIDQLKETNVQLLEQTRLLSEQNRILLDTLEQIKKQKEPEVPGK
jgi:hypothetical protein